MQLTVSNDAGYAAYKAVVQSFGGPDQVYYSKNANGVLIIRSVSMGYRHGISVSYDDSQGPTEAALLTDFPNAIEAAVSSIAY